MIRYSKKFINSTALIQETKDLFYKTFTFEKGNKNDFVRYYKNIEELNRRGFEIYGERELIIKKRRLDEKKSKK